MKREQVNRLKSSFKYLFIIFLAAVGVDLPDYILHYKGNQMQNLGNLREKLQKNGK